jgi:hypothetical protein
MSEPILTIVRPEIPALARPDAAESRIKSARSLRRMQDMSVAHKLAETSALLTGPRVFRSCRCGCRAALLPGFDGIYASPECEDRDRVAHGLRPKSKGKVKATSQGAPPSQVSRYVREESVRAGYPPAKSRSQIRWAKFALEQIAAGRHVDTRMSVDEIRALAATPEDGLPWKVNSPKPKAKEA